MIKNLLFASAILLITSCTNNAKTEKAVVTEPVIEKTLSLEFASKNPVTAGEKEGTHISSEEMLHLSLSDNSTAAFVGQSLTLNKPTEGAINFSYRNDSVFCNAPTSLMLMSMPPKPGIPPVMIGADTEFFVNPMSLLKFEDVNIMFVGLGK
jgi:hypothetical protein